MVKARVTTEAEKTIFKEKAEKMPREEIEKETEIGMKLLISYFWSWMEFKRYRDERKTANDFIGVRDKLHLMLAELEELGMYLGRLSQIADEEVGKKEKFDRGEAL